MSLKSGWIFLLQEPSSGAGINQSILISAASNNISDNRESSARPTPTGYYHDTTNSASGQNVVSTESHLVSNESVINGGTSSDNYTKFIRNKSAGTVNNRANGGKFSRDFHRHSMQFFGDGSSKWADAADR